MKMLEPFHYHQTIPTDNREFIKKKTRNEKPKIWQWQDYSQKYATYHHQQIFHQIVQVVISEFHSAIVLVLLFVFWTM